jgi:AbrB family looped-hinge helix DNA binding protein
MIARPASIEVEYPACDSAAISVFLPDPKPRDDEQMVGWSRHGSNLYWIFPAHRRILTLTGKSKDTTMRITSKGQVTIPIEIREQAGLLPHTEVDFEFDGEVVRIVRAANHKIDNRGARLVAHLRGRGDVTMSTDAIMALTRGE